MKPEDLLKYKKEPQQGTTYGDTEHSNPAVVYGYNEAIEDIIHLFKSDQNLFSVFTPYQLCPKCYGDGNLLRFNSPSMMGTDATAICDVCNGSKIIPMNKLRLSFEAWYEQNEAEINIELAETGADRELDFDSESEFDNRYQKYLNQ